MLLTLLQPQASGAIYVGATLNGENSVRNYFSASLNSSNSVRKYASNTFSGANSVKYFVSVSFSSSNTVRNYVTALFVSANSVALELLTYNFARKNKGVDADSLRIGNHANNSRKANIATRTRR